MNREKLVEELQELVKDTPDYILISIIDFAEYLIYNKERNKKEDKDKNIINELE